jgi:Predicted membrane protein (DUF2254)
MIPTLRNSHASAWFIPLLYAAGALVLGFTVPRLAYSILPGYLSAVSVSAAIGIYSAIASGMIALTGIVFSITFLMVQFSATVYSPRLVLWIARDRVLSHSMGVFTATFLYAIAALAWVDRGGSGRVPLSGTLLVMDQKGVNAILNGKTDLGKDATAAAGPTGATASAVGDNDILTYKRAGGNVRRSFVGRSVT